jgi:hypothetical protein
MIYYEAKDFPIDGLEATGDNVKVHVPRGAEWRDYILFGDQDGFSSITVYGDGNGDAYRNGRGDGDAHRWGGGNGSAMRNGDGDGNACRDGDGDGNAYRNGAGYGNAYRWGYGNGSAWCNSAGEFEEKQNDLL